MKKEASFKQGKHLMGLLPEDGDQLQALAENWDLVNMLMSVSDPKLIDRNALRAFLTKSKQTVNPHADQIEKSTWDYPSNFEMKDWKTQFNILNDIYPGFNADGLQEMAEGWLADKAIWEETYDCWIHDAKKPLYDGLLVFLLPGRVAKARLSSDLWSDIKKGREGEGVWGQLCEEMLFPHFAENDRYNGFVNWREGKMGSDHFHPTVPVAIWLEQLEAQAKGDFVCRPYSFGRATAGHSVQSSRWHIENIHNGISGPTWINGQALQTHPERLPNASCLWMNNGGDQYRLADGLRFLDTPYFCRSDDGLAFGTSDIFVTHDKYGFGFVRR
ncbi:MAG: hypothetical protein WC227_01515 [Patescibacteria group bacterium]|jgi:hypothetical protein